MSRAPNAAVQAGNGTRQAPHALHPARHAIDVSEASHRPRERSGRPQRSTTGSASRPARSSSSTTRTSNACSATSPAPTATIWKSIRWCCTCGRSGRRAEDCSVCRQAVSGCRQRAVRLASTPHPRSLSPFHGAREAEHRARAALGASEMRLKPFHAARAAEHRAPAALGASEMRLKPFHAARAAEHRARAALGASEMRLKPFHAARAAEHRAPLAPRSGERGRGEGRCLHRLPLSPAPTPRVSAPCGTSVQGAPARARGVRPPAPTDRPSEVGGPVHAASGSVRMSRRRPGPHIAVSRTSQATCQAPQAGRDLQDVVDGHQQCHRRQKKCRRRHGSMRPTAIAMPTAAIRLRPIARGHAARGNPMAGRGMDACQAWQEYCQPSHAPMPSAAIRMPSLACRIAIDRKNIAAGSKPMAGLGMDTCQA